jgi:hypothetical protein
VLVQITRTIPLRRTILQFSQIRLTLARTFMTAPEFQNRQLNRPAPGELVFIAENAPALKLSGLLGTPFA